jgi:hypothetical protein
VSGPLAAAALAAALLAKDPLAAGLGGARRPRRGRL